MREADAIGQFDAGIPCGILQAIALRLAHAGDRARVDLEDVEAKVLDLADEGNEIRVPVLCPICVVDSYGVHRVYGFAG